jgi:hypothetical protein
MTLAALAALLLSSAPPSFAADDERSVASHGTAILAPMNFRRTVPATIESGFRPTESVLTAYLKRSGYELKKLNLAKFRKMLREQGSTAVADESGRGNALPAVIRNLAERFAFDAFVVPFMVLRTKRTTGGGVQWDGVYQRIVLNYSSFNRGGNKFEYGRFDGDMSVVSLRVEVYDRGGELLHEGSGGLEVLQRAYMDYENWRFTFPVRDDLYEDPKVLLKGVRAAFDPFIPKK